MTDIIVKKTKRAKTPDVADVYAGNQLFVARKVKGISQEKLGEHLSVSFQQIQKYEKGKNRMSPRVIAMASDILGVSPAFFFRDGNGVPRIDPSPEAKQIAELMSSKDALELTRIYAGITDAKVRQNVVSIVRQIASIARDPKQAL